MSKGILTGWARSNRLNIINKYLYGTNILDIGTGDGWLVKELHKRNFNCYGIDVDISNFNSPNLLFGLIQNIPFEKDFFHTVLCVNVFEHIPKEDYKVAFKEINRVVKNGGRVIIISPKSHNSSMEAFVSALRFFHFRENYSEKFPHLSEFVVEETPFMLIDKGSVNFIENYGIYEVRKWENQSRTKKVLSG